MVRVLLVARKRNLTKTILNNKEIYYQNSKSRSRVSSSLVDSVA